MVLQKLHKDASGVTWFRATLNNPEFGLPAGDHDFGINREGEMLDKSGEPTQWGPRTRRALLDRVYYLV